MAVTFYVGQKLRALDLQRIIDDHPKVVRTSDLARISTATLADDTQLILPLKGGYTYLVSCVAYSTSASGADIQFALNLPSGAFTPFGAFRMVSSSAGATGDVDVGGYSSAVSGTSAIGVAGTGGVQTTRLEATVEMGSSDGNLTLMWAQLVSTASNTTLHRGSYLMGERVRNS